MDHHEFDRRASLEDRLYHFVLGHPGVWLRACDLRPVAGDAWRSRIVAVRRRLATVGLVFVWNRKNAAASAYMLRDAPLGPSAESPRERRLF